ncbi:hypothetical protein [Desulfoscipio gibsoniae]|uniref:hypothetical protein n=1 Tax=Desulfoscipio gibsoniae TaxID=102134 RepID=UPI0002EE0CB2|nr:hypothetical protein [Desulfoscipio gibsoniae]
MPSGLMKLTSALIFDTFSTSSLLNLLARNENFTGVEGGIKKTTWDISAMEVGVATSFADFAPL